MPSKAVETLFLDTHARTPAACLELATRAAPPFFARNAGLVATPTVMDSLGMGRDGMAGRASSRGISEREGFCTLGSGIGS